MKQFKSAGQVQRFLSAHDQINNLFHIRRDTERPEPGGLVATLANDVAEAPWAEYSRLAAQRHMQ